MFERDYMHAWFLVLVLYLFSRKSWSVSHFSSTSLLGLHVVKQQLKGHGLNILSEKDAFYASISHQKASLSGLGSYFQCRYSLKLKFISQNASCALILPPNAKGLVFRTLSHHDFSQTHLSAMDSTYISI